ncbi:MAG: P-loop NTPase fold protein [Gammaproteobacteria bacterium]|nr:P-loop NTPase fold protein [Gammaproteobacteria bacterium]
MHDNKTPDWPDSLAICEQLHDKLLPVFELTLKQESIPPEPRLMDNFSTLYLPLSAWIAQQQQQVPLVIGINGSQGSGKSTLCKILSPLIEQGFGKKVATLSIDDLYKTRQQRQHMSQTIHPLFETRGVPGSHDVDLGIALLTKIKQQTGAVKIPVFDKATDDRKDEKYWQLTHDKTDIVLFEGWCVAAVAEETISLATAMNALEKNDDPDARWRQYINQQLKTDYQRLFAFIDKLIMLKIPDFNKVIEWRTLQENKLKKNPGSNGQNLAMSDDALRRFIMHFERISKHTLQEMPARADVILDVGHDHQIQQIALKVIK